MVDKKTLLSIIGGQAIGLGMALNNLDSDKTGKDDLIGQIAVASGQACMALASKSEDEKKFISAIRAINSATAFYLGEVDKPTDG
jgi:hypothetical protein